MRRTSLPLSGRCWWSLGSRKIFCFTVTDNASVNDKIIDLIAAELNSDNDPDSNKPFFDANYYRLVCFGHVFNFIMKIVIFTKPLLFGAAPPVDSSDEEEDLEAIRMAKKSSKDDRTFDDEALETDAAKPAGAV